MLMFLSRPQTVPFPGYRTINRTYLIMFLALCV